MYCYILPTRAYKITKLAEVHHFEVQTKDSPVEGSSLIGARDLIMYLNLYHITPIGLDRGLCVGYQRAKSSSGKSIFQVVDNSPREIDH